MDPIKIDDHGYDWLAMSSEIRPTVKKVKIGKIN